MSNQQLDQEEILLVKWAHDDPNPVAQDAIDRANKDALVALMKAKGISIAEANFDYPANYSMPETKKMQLGDEKANALLQHFPELAYPDTDVQFNQPANAADSDAFYAQSGMTEEQYKQYWEYYNQYLTGMPGASTVGSSSATDADSSLQEVLAGKKRSLELLAGKNSEDNKQDISDEEENEDSADESNGWTVQKDDKTGASYFFNVYSGESSWTKPDGYLSN